MTDRELLELAAKAAGIELGEWMEAGVHKWYAVMYTVRPNGICWNPLTDDGDALRLAISLGIEIHPDLECEETITAFMADIYGRNTAEEWTHHDGDKMKATRRSIVRAAAEIGKAMQ